MLATTEAIAAGSISADMDAAWLDVRIKFRVKRK
jgi:hypothetical protein